MSLLVLGDLEFAPDQLDRLISLVEKVEFCRDPADPSIRRRLADARFVIACNFNLNPYLKELGSPGLSDRGLVVLAETGIVCLDPAQAEELGVRFTNLVGYSTNAVVQYIVRCILESRRPWEDVFGPYQPGPRTHKLGRGVDGATVGLVGFGHVGRALADILLPMGARVVATTRTPFRDDQVRGVALDELFRISDIVVVCCDLNQTSLRLIGQQHLRSLPRGGTLISISPNRVFDQAALVAGMTERTDVSAWLDFDPGADYQRLEELDNVHLSPHLAFFTEQTLRARVDRCIDRVTEFVEGRSSFRVRSARRTPIRVHDEGAPPRPEDVVLRVASRFYQSAALFAALDNHLFDVFGEGAETAATVAEKTGLDRRVLEGLLPALASSGLLAREEENAYRLPEPLAGVLHSSSHRYYGATALALRRHVQPAWDSLPAVLRSGAPAYLLQEKRASIPEVSQECTRGSDAQARAVASEVTKLLRRPDIRRIADLGCGSALITRSLLRELPDARADLVDTAAVLKIVGGNLEREGSSERCRLLATNYHSDEALQGTFDLVLLSNIIHMESTERAESLLRRSVLAMSATGAVAVISFMLGSETEKDYLVPHFSLSCRLLTREGHCHRATDVARWMRAAGCREVTSYPLTSYLDLMVGRGRQ